MSEEQSTNEDVGHLRVCVLISSDQLHSALQSLQQAFKVSTSPLYLISSLQIPGDRLKWWWNNERTSHHIETSALDILDGKRVVKESQQSNADIGE